MACILILGAIVVPTGHTKNCISNIVLSGAIALHDSRHHVLGYILIVCQQLLGVFRKAVAAIAKRRIVVVGADTRIETDAVDDGG